MKITALEECTDFITLDTEKLFSKLKSHELFRKGHPNHDASLTSKAFVTSTRVGGHVANPTNTTDSFALAFALSSCLQLLMSSTRASQMTRSPCWRESFVPCTSSARRGDLLRVASSAATPPTLSPTAPRGRSSTPPTSTTTTTEMTPATRVGARRSTAPGTRRKRSSRRWCPERVLPSTTSTSPVMTHPAQRRMRGPRARQVTSPAFTSWAKLRDTSPTSTLM
jgi:hypothetical protein